MTNTSDPSELRRSVRDAQARGAWNEMLQHAECLMRERAGDPGGYVFAASALRRMRRLGELQALLTVARQRFPHHPRLAAIDSDIKALAAPKIAAPPSDEATLSQMALRALERADWVELDRTAKRLRKTTPGDPFGFVAGVRALRETKRLRRADALSNEAMARFGDHPPLLLERALILQRLKRLDEAADCYAKLRQLKPDIALYYARGADALLLQGRFSEAETLIRHGLDRFPSDLELLVEFAISATRQQDFPTARARWAQVRAIAPDDPRLDHYAGSIALAERFQTLEERPALMLEQPAPTAADSDAVVLARFEALGGNCEFGLAQRVAGIEPLGLLRFAGIEIEDLLALLRCRFEGVGDPENTGLILNIQNEYMLVDRRFPSFRTHTYINLGDIDEETLHTSLCRRTRVLRDKLLAELRDGAKLFLYRPPTGLIDDATIAQLHAAFRPLGPATLVCARNTPQNDPTIRLTRPAPGLVVATIPGHQQKLTLGFVARDRYPHWIALCRAVTQPTG